MKDINGFILYVREAIPDGESFQFVIEWEDVPSDKHQFSFISNLCYELNRKFPELNVSFDVYSQIFNLSKENVIKRIEYQLRNE